MNRSMHCAVVETCIDEISGKMNVDLE